MCKHFSRLTPLFVFSFLVIGCTTPRHTNTLIFGTNTKIALDVSQDPVGAPSITLGYKRQEAVWMPLLANTKIDGQPCDNSNIDIQNCLFQGTEGDDKDTFSVIASLGATFDTSANAGPQTQITGQAKANAGLAQFIATGFAARKLAQHGGEKLLSIQPNNLSRDEMVAIGKAIEVENSHISDILTHVTLKGKLDNSLLNTLVDKVDASKIDSSTKSSLKASQDIKQLRLKLENSDWAVEPLFKAVISP